METVAAKRNTKPKPGQQLSVRPPIRRGCLFFFFFLGGGGGGGGGLSIGAASVSTPSHQTAA